MVVMRVVPLAIGCPFGVILALGLALMSCDTSSSASDREAHEQESKELQRINRQWADVERVDMATKRAFAAKYRGKVVSGVGCDVCSEICEIADLRPIAAPEYHRQFRHAAETMLNSKDDLEVNLAAHERWRLVCMARSAPSMRAAMLDLLDAQESPTVRIRVAVDLLREGLAKNEPRQVIEELAKETDETAFMARTMIAKWNEIGWPGH